MNFLIGYFIVFLIFVWGSYRMIYHPKLEIVDVTPHHPFGKAVKHKLYLYDVILCILGLVFFVSTLVLLVVKFDSDGGISTQLKIYIIFPLLLITAIVSHLVVFKNKYHSTTTRIISSIFESIAILCMLLWYMVYVCARGLIELTVIVFIYFQNRKLSNRSS